MSHLINFREEEPLVDKDLEDRLHTGASIGGIILTVAAASAMLMGHNEISITIKESYEIVNPMATTLIDMSVASMLLPAGILGWSFGSSIGGLAGAATHYIGKTVSKYRNY